MKKLYDEIISRFPEVRLNIREGDEDEPYLMMGYVSDWLNELRSAEMRPNTIQRVVDFSKWCEEQPRGKDAGDDILTIFVVAFYEKLFRSNNGRALLPRLISKDDLIGNAAYLKQWVGSENYDLALKKFH
jgi:hypothetical protein